MLVIMSNTLALFPNRAIDYTLLVSGDTRHYFGIQATGSSNHLLDAVSITGLEMLRRRIQSALNINFTY